MQCVIMAAGAGTRLRPLTDTCPKPLLEVAGRPILDWSLSHLPDAISEVLLVVGYRKDAIIARYGTQWGGKKITYVEQKKLLGTGHAVHICKEYLRGRFLVINGDDLYGKEDLVRLIDYPRAMLGKYIEHQGRFQTLQKNTEGKLIGFLEPEESQPPYLINVGAYVIDQHFFSLPLVPIMGGKEFGLPHTLAAMKETHPIDIIEGTFWIPIGFPEDLARATSALEAYGINR